MSRGATRRSYSSNRSVVVSTQCGTIGRRSLWAGCDHSVFMDDYIPRISILTGVITIGDFLNVPLGFLHSVLFLHNKYGASRLEKFIPPDLRNEPSKQCICTSPS